MKLEIKAEEALGVEEEIVQMKHKTICELLEAKQVKRREVIFKTEEIESEYDEKNRKLKNTENKMQSLANRIESDEITCKQIDEYINRM